MQYRDGVSACVSECEKVFFHAERNNIGQNRGIQIQEIATEVSLLLSSDTFSLAICPQKGGVHGNNKPLEYCPDIFAMESRGNARKWRRGLTFLSGIISQLDLNENKTLLFCHIILIMFMLWLHFACLFFCKINDK